MRAVTGLALAICLSFAVVADAVLSTSEEEFTTCILFDLTEAKVEKTLGYLDTYQTANNWIKRFKALASFYSILANNDILDCLTYEEESSGQAGDDEDFFRSFDTRIHIVPYGNDEIYPPPPRGLDDEDLILPDNTIKVAPAGSRCVDDLPQDDCAELKAYSDKIQEFVESSVLPEIIDEIQVPVALCKKTWGLCDLIKEKLPKKIHLGKKLRHLKDKLTASQAIDTKHKISRRSLKAAALQETPDSCDDLINSFWCRIKRDRGDCHSDQQRMAEICFATCECKDCMKTGSCAVVSDFDLLFPEPEENNQEKKYSYVKYIGDGMQDDITDGVTICAVVAPFDISNQLYVIADYAVSPVSYTDTYTQSDINRDLRKLRLEYNRGGIYLTADNLRKNLGNIPRQSNLILETEFKSRVCVTYDLNTKKAIAYMNGRQGQAIDMNANTDIIQGKGILVIGQDQGRMEGGFDANRGMEGMISHFKLYKQFFNEDIMTAATQEDGSFPENAEVDINTSNVKVFGRATLELEE